MYAGVYRNARDWLMSAWGLSEDQAITLLTVACDFNVHQVGAAAAGSFRQHDNSCRPTVAVVVCCVLLGGGAMFALWFNFLAARHTLAIFNERTATPMTRYCALAHQLMKHMSLKHTDLPDTAGLWRASRQL
jgi:hypothetical protein